MCVLHTIRDQNQSLKNRRRVPDIDLTVIAMGKAKRKLRVGWVISIFWDNISPIKASQNDHYIIIIDRVSGVRRNFRCGSSFLFSWLLHSKQQFGYLLAQQENRLLLSNLPSQVSWRASPKIFPINSAIILWCRLTLRNIVHSFVLKWFGVTNNNNKNNRNPFTIIEWKWEAACDLKWKNVIRLTPTTSYNPW